MKRPKTTLKRGGAARAILVAWAVFLLVGLGVFAAAYAGFWDVAGPVVLPLPGLIPGAVDALVAIVETTRFVAPIVLVAAIALHWTMRIRSRSNSREAMLQHLSRSDFSGTDRMSENDSGPGIVRAIKTFTQGTGLATLAVVLVGATSGIEEEISEGPLRPIDALSQIVGVEGDPFYILQSPSITFMDDSSLDAADALAFVDGSAAKAVPFGKHLFTIDDLSAVELSIPDETYAVVAGVADPASCVGRSIIVDDTVGVRAGDAVVVNGLSVTVARVIDGIAQMNRSIGVLADSTVRECILGGTSSSYFGVLVQSDDPGAILADMATASLRGSLVSAADFRENNRDFWRANATPLLLQLILYLALFSAFAAAGERRSALQRNVREIGMMHSMGVSFAALRRVEQRRALRITLKATCMAAPLMIPVAAAFNASELGLQIGIGLTEVAVGSGLTLIAMSLASHRALKRFEKDLDLTMAVKG